MSDERRVSIPEVLADFAAYFRNNGAWGSLHVVLDDGNVRDRDVRFCIGLAAECGDVDGERIANILLSMSRTQRLRLPSKVHALTYPAR